MDVGIHDWRSYSETLSKFPKTTQVREFVPGVLDPHSDDLTYKINRLVYPALDLELTPWVSFKLLPSDVHEGAWDSQLEHAARNVPDEAYLIPWHEPENDMTADEFTGMFNYVANLLKSEGFDGPIVYSAMTYQFRPGSPTTNIAPDWFPETADIYAADVYSGGTWPLDYILPEHPGFIRWNEKRQLADSRQSKVTQWAVTERGFITSDNPELRAATIEREAAWLADSDCEAYIYWNTSGTEGNPDIILDERHGEPAVNSLLERLSDDDRYDEGFSDGHLVGFNEGFDSGRANGFWEGHEAAVNEMRTALDEIDDGE